MTIEKLTTLLENPMKEVNKVILEKMGSNIPLIMEIANHLISAGGKRMRPMLTLAGALVGNSNHLKKEVYSLAAAVEFIHSATLLHDDVIDGSKKRRGKDTINFIWGNELSVLVGDFLFARSFELMVETDSLQILEKLSNASVCITEGEIKQSLISGNPNSSISDYYDVINGKTAKLFAVATETGCIANNGKKKYFNALHDFGLSLGRAFQICDDALDYTNSKNNLGKNLGDDFKEGKITLPVILAWQESNELEKNFWERTLSEKQIIKGDLEMAQKIIKKYNCIDRTLKIARDDLEIGVEKLSIIPSSPVKEALLSLTDFVTERTY